MTYLDLLRDADRQLDDGRITIGEYEQMIKPLECEVQPEVIFCKDCTKHNKSYGDNGTIDSCPLVLYRGKAQGHEFDYQYCAFAERRTE